MRPASDVKTAPDGRLSATGCLWQAHAVHAGSLAFQVAPDRGVSAPLGWWERPGGLAALILLFALPLLWPETAPLVDLPGHIGRYRVQLDLASSPELQRFYEFNWSLIGNLGVDLLVVPLAKLFGLELAVKLIVLTIPPLTVAGFLWVAREVHGRVPPTALFALPLAYGFPFIFGFVNFALSMAFAFLAFGLWLRLARLGRFRLRAILFVPLSLALWMTHMFGWGTLGLLAFSAEVVRQWDTRPSADGDTARAFAAACIRAALHAAAIAPPLLLMLLSRSEGVGGETGDWFNLTAKSLWVTMALRDRWVALDIGSLGVIFFVLYLSWRNRSVEFSRNLLASAGTLLLVFVCLPRIIFGSAYADMRLVPYLLAAAILAVRMVPGADAKWMKPLAAMGLAFVLLRVGAHTVSFWLFDRDMKAELAALEHLPRGARVVSFVGLKCGQDWRLQRNAHVPAFALIRRKAFSNDQWTLAGAQLLRVRYPAGGRFINDPSQMVTEKPCGLEVLLTLDQSLRQLPRGAFDYVWLIDPPRYDPRAVRSFRPLWRDGNSVLFQIAP